MAPIDITDVNRLPVHRRRDDILASVDQNQVTIIVAETGAGKSTQVPQYLAEHGYQRVIVTQPRILAARNLSSRVRQEYSWRLGRDATALVGYRTAMERDDDPDNVILYCTDGLQLVRELTGSGTKARQILVLDEIHEWNENMEVLVAWAKRRCQEDPAFKVVLMSATIEANTLAAYFNAPEPITVAGRSYPVEKRFGSEVVEEISRQLERGGRNMLVFLPGKAEIEAVAEAIAPLAAASSVPVIPLHSQLEPEQQQLAFGNYPQGKVILSTNVAQTSITIDDIDVVIDSGLERRAEVRNGVEGLFISEVSRADCLQRAGRAGRTREGTYILARLDNLPCSPLEERAAYGVPEIMRGLIDRLVLRLANIGIDIETLEFYHSPSRTTIKQAKRTLASLGALIGGQVTPIGRRMERFPVESSYARMLVEAENYPTEIQDKLAAIIALQEVGGIIKGGPKYSGWRRYTKQHRSDLLAQYEVYLSLPQIDPEDYDEIGIISKNVDKAEEVNQRLHRDLGLGEPSQQPVSDNEIEPLLKAVVSGQLHQLWSIEPDGQAMHLTTRKYREVSSGTVVKGAGLVSGTPFDLEIQTPKGLETLHLVNDLTAVNPEWLEELSPDKFKVRPGQIYFDSRMGTMASRSQVRYGNRVFETSGAPLLDYTPENQRMFTKVYAMWAHEQLEHERRKLAVLGSRRIPDIPLKQIQQMARDIAPGAVSLLELSKQQRIELGKLARLETYLGEDFMAGIGSGRRGAFQGGRNPGGQQGFRRGGWKPSHKRKFNRRKGF